MVAGYRGSGDSDSMANHRRGRGDLAGTGPGDSPLRADGRVRVLNEALQILRYPHRRWEHLGTDAATAVTARESMDDEIQARDDLRLVWKAIGELPRMRREVVLLWAAGYEYTEIAARLRISISAVRSHISYARKQLSRTVPRDWKGRTDE